MLKTENTQARKTISRPEFNVLPLRTLFNRQYWWATLVVLLGMAFLARLGIVTLGVGSVALAGLLAVPFVLISQWRERQGHAI